MEQPATLYYMEISEQNKLINLIKYGKRGYDILLKVQQDEKAQHDEQVKKEREDLEKSEKKESRKEINMDRLDNLAKPKDKWKLGRRLLEI